jgi:hypothetical protein
LKEISCVFNIFFWIDKNRQIDANRVNNSV